MVNVTEKRNDINGLPSRRRSPYTHLMLRCVGDLLRGGGPPKDYGMGEVIRKVKGKRFLGWYLRFIDADGRRKQRASGRFASISSSLSSSKSALGQAGRLGNRSDTAPRRHADVTAHPARTVFRRSRRSKQIRGRSSDAARQSGRALRRGRGSTGLLRFSAARCGSDGADARAGRS